MSSPKQSVQVTPVRSFSSTTATTTTATATASSSSLVKYCGRAVVASSKDPDYKSVVQRLLSLTQDLQQNGSYRTDADWNAFFADLSAFTNHIVNPDIEIQRFQVDLISESLLPYITKLKGRFYTDKARVRQLSDIMYALTHSDKHHPAFTLLVLEQVRNDIQGKQSYFWKSELLSILDTALAKQWRPILHDMKALLYDAAGKLIGFGLIGVIGWPLVLAGPILMNAEKLVKVVKEWETQHRMSPQSIFEVVKILVLMFALLQIMSIVRMYQSLGILSMVMGAAAFVVTMQESFLKQIAPMFATHAVVYERYLHTVNTLDYNEAIGLWKRLITSSTSASAASAAIDANNVQSHPQVEELPVQQKEATVAVPIVTHTPVHAEEKSRNNVISPIPISGDSFIRASESGEGTGDSDYVMLDSDLDPDSNEKDQDSFNTGVRQRRAKQSAT